MMEIEEKWLLCPGEVIFEQPTELTNKFVGGNHVQWAELQGTDRLENSTNNVTGNVRETNIQAHSCNHCCSG